MKARILTATAVVLVVSGVLPARAADPQLLSLVMPDAKVVAGVNVTQAKGSPFGQYVLQHITSQDRHLQEMSQQTGFDPTRDVHELLIASSSVSGKDHSGLLLARGNFNVAGITSAATAHHGFVETYGPATLIRDDPKGATGIAFVDTTLAVMGDLANVKAAIDRLKTPASLPAGLLAQINEWSNSQDAWVVSAVPPTSLHPPSNAPKIPGVGPGQNAFDSIQRGGGGVRFGSLVTVKAQGEADTAQNAQQMGDALKLLASMAQMQSAKDSAVTALLQSLSINSQSNVLTVSASLPSEQLIQLVTPKKRSGPAVRSERKN